MRGILGSNLVIHYEPAIAYGAKYINVNDVL